MQEKLKSYRNKRDFRRTSEPSGEQHTDSKQQRFVIQKHAASHLHYDLRLEIDGVLVSWAVPKGLSTDPRDKRLAIQTEDHPLAYIDFEGVIPAGEYGGGTILVWDSGSYRNLREQEDGHGLNMQDALQHGLIRIALDGEKLKGGYLLKRIAEGEKPRWLVIKMDDEHADARRRPTSTQPESVKSGRSLEQIRQEGEKSD